MATEVMLAIDANGRPSGATPRDADALAELAGSTCRAVLTTPAGRSVTQLKLWFGMCGLIADNHPADLTKENVSDTLKIECGHASVWQDCTGLYRRSPKSIAFNAMSSADFSRLLDLALVKASDLFGDDLTLAVRRELESMGAPDLTAANDTPSEKVAA